MKKALLALLVACSLMLGIAGCGPTASQPTPTPASTPQVPASATQPTETAPAKSDYPKAPITWIVPYSAGGGTDLAVRTFIKYLEPLVGQSIVVSNLSGGGGTIGVTELYHSKPDGYTMGTVTLASQVISKHQMDLEYTMDDFEYLGSYAQWTYGIVVNADSPYQDVEDVIAAGKEAGGLQFGAAGTINGFALLDLGEVTGAEFDMVFYGNTTDCTTDCLGGFIPCIAGDIASVSSYIESGQMRLLASASEKRWPAAPDVPTLQELGYDVSVSSYTGLAFPKGTDPDTVAFMQDCFNQVCANKDFQEELYELCSLQPIALDGPTYYQLLQDLEKDYAPRLDTQQ